MLKDSPLYSVLYNKCPRCHEGDFFVKSSAFTRKFDEMHTHCPHCHLSLIPEPGFYWGSMFVSYAFYTAFTVIAFLVSVVWLNVDVDYFLIGLVPALIVLTPYFFRLARRTWLTFFVSYKPVTTP
nr:DUF983 domain-containing protein [uncultured Arsenicibacter sp.]